MNTSIVKNMSRFCAALALTAFFAAPHGASAQSLPGTSGPSTTGSAVVFTFTTAGQNNPAAVNSGPTLGGPSTNVSTTTGGSYIFTTNAAGNGSFEEFSGVNGTGKDLLSGTITDLYQSSKSIQGTTQFQTDDYNVTYTGGSELLSAGYTVGTLGSLGLTLSGITAISGTNNGYQATSYGVSYNVNTPITSTPEPTGLAVFGILGAGLLGAVVLRRKQTGNFAA